MRIIKLMPKANEDLEGIWYYSYHHFGEPQADRYVEHLSDVLQILSNNNIGTPRPELGEGIFVLPPRNLVKPELPPLKQMAQARR